MASTNTASAISLVIVFQLCSDLYLLIDEETKVIYFFAIIPGAVLPNGIHIRNALDHVFFINDISAQSAGTTFNESASKKNHRPEYECGLKSSQRVLLERGSPAWHKQKTTCPRPRRREAIHPDRIESIFVSSLIANESRLMSCMSSADKACFLALSAAPSSSISLFSLRTRNRIPVLARTNGLKLRCLSGENLFFF